LSYHSGAFDGFGRVRGDDVGGSVYDDLGGDDDGHFLTGWKGVRIRPVLTATTAP
jgi:hypothetical protein